MYNAGCLQRGRAELMEAEHLKELEQEAVNVDEIGWRWTRGAENGE